MSLRSLSVFAFLLWALPIQAENSSYYQFRHSARSKVCKNRLDKLREVQRLFELPAFKQYVRNGKTTQLTPALASWSTDLLIKIALQLDQDYRVLCPEHKQAGLVLEAVRHAYLARLGFNTKELRAYQTEKLFKGLIAFKAEVPKLRERLQALRAGQPSADQILPQLFGPVQSLNGVSVFGATSDQLKNLRAVVNEVCKGFEACPFWGRRLIYKTIVRAEPGVAMYVPEVAVLIISADLINKPNTLHKVVLLHELTHVAARGAWVYERQAWVGQFASLGGWKKDARGKWQIKTRRLAGKRQDELTILSKESPYTILPDPIYVGDYQKGKYTGEGFVLGKSYEESLKNNDPSEDLADHVALYFYQPDRFCLQGKNLAPKKYAWIAKNVFRKKKTTLDCN